METLFPKDTYDGYEPKDYLFEVWKLVKESDKNSKYSQLFYEVRHKEYDKTWNDYSEHFWRDVGDQVFATLIASAVSFAIIASSIGLATPLAHVAYFGVYSVISRFQMDMKAKEAEAAQRSSTFYPEGADRSEPYSLNQKYHTDDFWGDSMPTALSGHPGAYYTTVMGGEGGAQYTAQAIVSPPNDARFWDMGNFPGVLDYLGHNVATFGRGDLDKFTALDFDNHNLDFLLVSSELYAYNDEQHYTYLEDPALVDVLFDAEPIYERYTTVFGQTLVEYITGPEYALDQIKLRDSYLFRQNTLGYLTKKIRQASNGSLTTIKATCVDGQPQYVFTTGEDVVPKSALFQPLIVSPERYEELESRGLVDGYIVVDVQALSLASTLGVDTRGIDSNELTTEERSLYDAKIPLADIFGGFDYPIKSIEVFGICDDQDIDSRLLATSEYNVSLGNLYFTKSLEQLIPIFVNYETNMGLMIEFPSHPVPSEEFYYKFVIRVAKIVPDDGSEESARSALNIATTYAVMGYFDQYTYAQTSAQMIAEVGYTEIMTITSTAISAPFVALGAYAAKTAQEATATATKIIIGTTTGQQALQQVGQQASKFALNALIFEIGKRVIIGTIAETVEEIVVDGFFETAVQSAVRMVGGTDAAGHWISTLFTSLRETANFGYLIGGTGAQTQQGFAGQVQNAMELSTDFQSTVASMLAQNEELDLAQVAAANEQFLTAQMAEIGILGETLMESKISLGRILATGIFTGLSLLAPSLAGFNLYAISKLIGGIGTRINAKSQNKFLAARNSMMLLKDAIEIEMQKVEMGKKPINTQPEVNLPDAPIVPSLREPANPSLERAPVEFATTGANFMNILDIRDDYGRLLMHPKAIESQLNKEMARAEKMRVEVNQEIIENLDGKVSEVLTTVKDNLLPIEVKPMEELIESLKGKKYQDYDILVYGGVYYKVIDIINDKSKNDEILTQLENDILDAGAYTMGGMSFEAVIPPLYRKNDWDKSQVSNYFPHFKSLLETLKTKLSSESIIKNTQGDLEKVLKANLRDFKSDFNKKKKFNIEEETLDLWFIRIRNKINSATLDRQTKTNLINSIKVDITNYYTISGWFSRNPLYRNARYLIIEIGEILLEETVITKNTFKAVEQNLLKYGEGDFCDFLKWTNFLIPSDDHIGILRGKLEAEIKSIITSVQYARIERLVESYSDNIEAYKRTVNNFIEQDLIEEPLLHPFNIKNTFSSFREYLFILIQVKMFSRCEVLRDISFAAMSRLLFGDSDYLTNIFWSEDGIYRRPDLYVLERIKLFVSLWETPMLKSEGLDIDPNSLKQLKSEVENVINEFIYKNPYEVQYINENPTRGRGRIIKTLKKDDLIPESELISSIWKFFAIYKDKPLLTFNDLLTKSFGKTHLSKILSSGKKNIGKKTLKNLGVILVKAYREALSGTHVNSKIQVSQEEKLRIYENTFRQLFKYAKTRKINLFKTITKEYQNLWYNPFIMASHNVLLFARQLGFDLLTFTPLDDQIYSLLVSPKNHKYSLFRRHHTIKNNKRSIFLQELLATDASMHGSYENIDTPSLIKAYNELIMKDGVLTEEDIEKVFSKYGFKNEYNTLVITNSKFTEFLATFNKRKQIFKEEGLDALFESDGIKTKYPSLYGRFYEKFKNSGFNKMRLLALLVKSDNTRDYSDLIAVHYFFSRYPNLANEYNFVPSQEFRDWFSD